MFFEGTEFRLPWRNPTSSVRLRMEKIGAKELDRRRRVPGSAARRATASVRCATASTACPAVPPLEEGAERDQISQRGAAQASGLRGRAVGHIRGGVGQGRDLPGGSEPTLPSPQCRSSSVKQSAAVTTNDRACQHGTTSLIIDRPQVEITVASLERRD